MLNTNWLLEDARKIYRQYQDLYQRVNQLEREWVSVPFHWSDSNVAWVRSVSERYQSVCAYEIDWRLKQYYLHETAALEDTDMAEIYTSCKNTYWSELSDWRNEEMYARLLVQRVERALVTYQEYQERAAAEHAAYMKRVGIE